MRKKGKGNKRKCTTDLFLVLVLTLLSALHECDGTLLHRLDTGIISEVLLE
jgi:hypothetical protein